MRIRSRFEQKFFFDLTFTDFRQGFHKAFLVLGSKVFSKIETIQKVKDKKTFAKFLKLTSKVRFSPHLDNLSETQIKKFSLIVLIFE